MSPRQPSSPDPSRGAAGIEAAPAARRANAPTAVPTDDELAAAVALAALPRLTAARLRRLIVRHGPVEAYQRILTGAIRDDPWLDRSLGARRNESDLAL